MDGRRRRDVKETYDLGLGFIGAFTAAFLIMTFIAEVTGNDALWSAITTLVLALMLTALWFVRRRHLRVPVEADADEH